MVRTFLELTTWLSIAMMGRRSRLNYWHGLRDPTDSHPPGRLGSRSCLQLTHSEPIGPAVHFLIGTQSLSEGVSCAALLNASRKPFVGEVALLPIQLEELTDRDPHSSPRARSMPPIGRVFVIHSRPQ
jgi:hypothetical protein